MASISALMFSITSLQTRVIDCRSPVVSDNPLGCVLATGLFAMASQGSKETGPDLASDLAPLLLLVLGTVGVPAQHHPQHLEIFGSVVQSLRGVVLPSKAVKLALDHGTPIDTLASGVQQLSQRRREQPKGQLPVVRIGGDEVDDFRAILDREVMEAVGCHRAHHFDDFFVRCAQLVDVTSAQHRLESVVFSWDHIGGEDKASGGLEGRR